MQFVQEKSYLKTNLIINDTFLPGSISIITTEKIFTFGWDHHFTTKILISQVQKKAVYNSQCIKTQGWRTLYVMVLTYFVIGE